MKIIIAIAFCNLVFLATAFGSANEHDNNVYENAVTLPMPPAPGDSCHQAIALTVQSSCMVQTFSTENATSESDAIAPFPFCGFYSGNDVWFTVVVPSNGQLRIARTNNDAFNGAFAVYTGVCGAFTQIACRQKNSNIETLLWIMNEPDLAGQTLHIRVWNRFSTDAGTFNLCVLNPLLPDNDLISGAYPLPVGSACNPQLFSNADYSGSFSDLPVYCGFLEGGDAWFSAVVPASGHLRLEISGSLGMNPQFSIYTGYPAWSEWVCAQNRPNYTLHNVAMAGSTLHIRVWNYFDETGGDFSLCAWEPDIPDNDYCADAIPIAVGASCSMQTFENRYCDWVNETCFEQTTNNSYCDFVPGTGNLTYPTCGFFEAGDVWFTLEMPLSGHLRIERENIADVNAQFALYSGTCGNLIEVECTQLRPSMNIHNEALAGQTLYLRVWNYFNTDGGTFSICAWEPDMPDNDFYADAIALNVGSSCNMQSFTTVYTTTPDPYLIADPPCGFFMDGDIWFTLIMPASGHLRIETNDIANSLVQYALYDGDGGMGLVQCKQLLPEQNIHRHDLAGHLLYLRVWDYFDYEGGTFELCAWEPPIPENDFCENAAPLPFTNPCQYTTVDYTYCTSGEGEPYPGCGYFLLTDIWYTVTVPVSGMFTLNKNYITPYAGEVVFYTGSCNALTEYQCYQLTNSIEFNEPAMAGQTLRLRFFTYGSPVGGSFEVNLNTGASSCSGDLDSNGLINTSDLLLFMSEFGTIVECGGSDFDGNSLVNTSDLLLFMSAFGTVCF